MKHHYNYDVKDGHYCPDCDSARVVLTDRIYGYAECLDCGATSDPDHYYGPGGLYEGQREDS